MNAYNYAQQRWVSGQEAVTERLLQLRDHLDLLRSARGAEYLRFTGARLTVEEAIEHTEALIEEIS